MNNTLTTVKPTFWAGKGAMGLATVVAATVALTTPAKAFSFTEVGDAGNSFATAQSVTGPANTLLTEILGSLTSGDNDFFRFIYTGIGQLRISTGPYTNTPFPANTFPGFELFSAAGLSLGGAAESNSPPPFGDQSFISGGNVNYEFGSSTIIYENLLAGEYVLRIDGTGQVNSGRPVYIGDYSFRLTSAEGLPEPEAIPTPALLPGLLGLGVAALRKRSTQGSGEAEKA